MILVKEFVLGKATGLQSLNLLKKIYFSFFSRWKWRTAILRHLSINFWTVCKPNFPVDIYLFKLWNMFKINNKGIRTTSILLFWRIHCEIGTSKWQCSLVSCLGWTQYPLKQILSIHIYSLNKRRNK